MDTKTFLGAVLGDAGNYCVWARRLSDGRKVQKFYETIDAALHAATSLDEDGYDAYFALGTFERAGSRKADNVQQMRSFFLDLDCGQEKFDNGEGYLTQADALTDLRGLCKRLKLPRPTLVNSGRGIHVYWPLTEPVSRETWVPVAEQFKALCQREGLIIDAAVPADAARILRVPGTHNYKDAPPKAVHLVGAAATPVTFDAFRDLLGAENAEKEQTYTPSTKNAVRDQDALMQALAGSYTSRFRTILMKTTEGKGCAQLHEVVVNQANISEPLWRAGLSIAKFCVDGGTAIHKISNKHPKYTPDATEEKAALIKGPYLCARFDEFRPGVCTNCMHWNKIKSPISLGREVMEAEAEDNIVVQKPMDIPNAKPIEYTIPKYPSPYFRGKNGGIFLHQKGGEDDDEPRDKLIYHNDLYVVRRLRDPDLGEALVMRLHLPRDGVREFTLPLTAVGSKDDFRKHLAMQGVTALNVSELMGYTMRWVSELQFKAEATEARRQFGWTDDKGTSFAVGNMEIFKDRVEINSPSTATAQYFPYFAPKGTFEGWKQTMEFFNRPGCEVHQFMFGISLGAPLMQFQAINAAAFHIYSKHSGLGKTTSMLAGASVWGAPDLIMLQENDTHNSRMNRAEVYKNLPVYMDEMTNTKAAELSDWAYQLPNGQQRNRMSGKHNVERTRGKLWKELFGSTGNASLIERISTYKRMPEAEAQRILEHNVSRVIFNSKEETDEFSNAIKEHYGHAGVVYIQYLLNNLEAAKELANVNQRKIDAAAGLTAENRFWSALASRVITGLMLGKRAGLINWEIAPIAQWVVKVLKAAKAMTKEMANESNFLLTDYLAENYNNILRIKSTDDARKQNTGLDHLIHPEAVPRMNFVARYEYDVKKLYLLPKPLKEWCVKQQINYAGLLDTLREAPTNLKREKMRLSRGTHMNLPPADVLTIDCSSFMHDEAEQSMATTAALLEKQAT